MPSSSDESDSPRTSSSSSSTTTTTTGNTPYIQIDSKDKSTVFVRNLPFDVTHEILQDAFEVIGPVKRAFVVVGPRGPRGFGFVQYALAIDAEEAVKQFHNQKEMSGRKLKVELAVKPQSSSSSSSSSSHATTSTDPKQQTPRDDKKSKKSGSSDNSDAENDNAGRKHKKQQHHVILPSGCRSLLVTGLSTETTQKRLYKRLRKACDVVSVVLPAPESTPNNIVARVLCSTHVDAIKCVKLEGQTLHGASLHFEALPDRAARLIVRNIPFMCTTDTLRELFGGFGTITDVHLPSKVGASNQTRGFGFITCSDIGEAAKIVANGNGLRIEKRTLAIDWSLPKNQFVNALQKQQAQAQDEETKGENEEGDGGGGGGGDDDDDDESTSKKRKSVTPATTEDATSDMTPEEAAKRAKKTERNRKRKERKLAKKAADREAGKKRKTPPTTASSSSSSNDVDKGSTVFIRNLAYDTTEEQLQAKFEEFGRVKVAKIVLDKEHNNRPKGTAFVQFFDPESAQTCLTMATTDAGLTEGILLQGRVLSVSLAVRREQAAELAATTIAASSSKKARLADAAVDKRHLALAEVGVILDQRDGMSDADHEKRKHAWQEKKVKLKNKNYKVSLVRLSVRNMPLSMTDASLRKLVVQSGIHGGVKQVKVVRDRERMDQEGQHRSKRYGFVELHTHDDAKQVIDYLNNNPALDGVPKASRLMVEFALDDSRRLLARDRGIKRRADLQADKLNDGEDGGGGDGDGGSSSSRKRKARACHKCGKVGHLAKKCRGDDGDEVKNDEKQQSKKRKREKKPKQQQQHEEEEEKTHGDVSMEETMVSTNNNNSKKKKIKKSSSSATAATAAPATTSPSVRPRKKSAAHKEEVKFESLVEAYKKRLLAQAGNEL